MKIAGLSRQVARALLTSQYANMLEYRVEIALWGAVRDPAFHHVEPLESK